MIRQIMWRLFVAYIVTNALCSDLVTASFDPLLTEFLKDAHRAIFTTHVIAEVGHHYWIHISLWIQISAMRAKRARRIVVIALKRKRRQLRSPR